MGEPELFIIVLGIALGILACMLLNFLEPRKSEVMSPSPVGPIVGGLALPLFMTGQFGPGYFLLGALSGFIGWSMFMFFSYYKR